MQFDNLQHFHDEPSSIRYWSWRDFSHPHTREPMQWNAINHSPADYLRAEAYAGQADFSIIGQHYAHLSPLGAIEWSWSIKETTSWRISIDMYFIYSHCQSRQVVELWQDDILLWRRGFTAALPVADCLMLETKASSGELRLLVISETPDIASAKFVYRLKLSSQDADHQIIDSRYARVAVPEKSQQYAGLQTLLPNLQRKLYETEYPVAHLTPDEKVKLQQAVTAKVLQQLNVSDRIFGENGYFSVKEKVYD